VITAPITAPTENDRQRQPEVTDEIREQPRLLLVHPALRFHRQARSLRCARPDEILRSVELKAAMNTPGGGTLAQLTASPQISESKLPLPASNALPPPIRAD
jgi:hypothetical protein